MIEGRRGPAGGGGPAEGHADSAAAIEELLQDDPFRYTQSDRDLARLLKLSRARSPRPYGALLRSLLGAAERLQEPAARALWERFVEHRRLLGRKLGRPVPLRAAAIDWLYLHDAGERPIEPMVVSRSALTQVLRQGRTDPLTGLPRRPQLERAVQREVQRQPFAGGCVVFVDLDGFKRANDRLGHAAGDAVLRRFARLARAQLRKGDLVARVGGDELVLVLCGVSPRAARQVALRLRERFEQASERERVSFSFGVASLRPGELPAAVLARADAAMYRQKRRRRTERRR